MASMFWPLKLYYVLVDYRAENVMDELSRYPPKDVVSLPTFHSEPPRKKAVQALRLLIDGDGQMASSELSKTLRESGVIRPMRGEELSAQAAHSQLQSILDSLVHMRFIMRGVGGEKNHVEVTDEGRAAFRLFADHESELP